MVTYSRDALIDEVWRTVLDDIVYIPLHQQVIVWAMRNGMELPVDPWNQPRFRLARLNR
jgi:peptide/nickel transport system substrate-binding protein